MTFYFLIYLLMLATGETATIPVSTYSTFEACEAAGRETTVKVVADAKIKQGVWRCLDVDFDAADHVGPQDLPAKPPRDGNKAD